MESLQEIRTYEEFKAATDREVYNQAQGFVRLGYLLRRAEDTDILRESGYRTVTEFAKAEYGLTETYVSRYIAINRRYSEGGYSDRLQGRFEGFGMAKLADMLTLPGGVVEVIPQEATRAEIQEIKREVVMEQQVSDLEVLTEKKDHEEKDLLAGMLREYYRAPETLEEYRQVHAALRQEEAGRRRELYHAMAPADTAAKMARVAGAGRMLLAIRGMDQDPELLNIRSGEKRSCTWEELHDRLEDLFGGEGTPEQSWEAVYKIPYPETEETEPVRKKAVVGIARPEPERKRPEENTENREKEEPHQEESIREEKEGQEKVGEEMAEIAPVQESPAQKPSVREIAVPEPARGQVGKPHQEETGAAPPPDSAPRPESIGEPESQKPESTPPYPQETVIPRGQQDYRKDEIIAGMKKEAMEQAEEILKAIGKSYYNMARMGMKKLWKQLEAIGKELERKGVPGQIEFSSLTGLQTEPKEEEAE